MEKFTTIIAIASSIAGLGLFAVLKNLIKEIKELKDKYEEAKADGMITEQEEMQIAKEAMDVIVQVIKLKNLILKAVGLAKKKK